MLYRNGEVPYSVVSVVLASGTDQNGYWEMRATPATAARWKYAKALCEKWYGRPIYIRTGWNIYRPLHIQKEALDRACRAGNCLSAAYPGTSSHGGNWNGRDCLAIDVDPNGLSWAQVDKAMIAAGFAAGLITQAISGRPGGEPWHYIDFNAFGPVPAFDNVRPFEEDDMTPEQARQLNSIFNAIFDGGNSMKDGGKSISQSLRDIQDKLAPVTRGGKPVSIRQEIADTKTTVLTLQAQNAGLLEAIKQIGAGKVDLGAIQAAAEKGAQAALGSLRVTIEAGE